MVAMKFSLIQCQTIQMEMARTEAHVEVFDLLGLLQYGWSWLDQLDGAGWIWVEQDSQFRADVGHQH